jgi:hypothetical protein
VLVDRGRRISFSFEDVLKYHGGGSPGGAALAFKAIERALPLLEPPSGDPCERREIVIETAFRGPGAPPRLAQAGAGRAREGQQCE